MAHRLGGVQAEGARRLVLPAGDGLHAGADDFRHVGAGEQCQRGDPGELAGEVQHGADEEVEDEDLHQQRRTAHQFDVDGGQVAQGGVVRQPAEAGDEADCQPEGAGQHGYPQGGPEAPEQGTGRPVAGNADQVALGNVVALAHLQAVAGHVQHLFLAAFGSQGHAGHGAGITDGADRAVISGALAFLGLVGEVLGHAVPAPFIGNQRSGVPEAIGNDDQDHAGQNMPGPVTAMFSRHVESRSWRCMKDKRQARPREPGPAACSSTLGAALIPSLSASRSS
ncbi:hypothetical protein D3C76_1024060 [compost metagenome]